MNNKDLFNAIHDVSENYITDAWNGTESERPIELRPERSSAKNTFRNIMLGVGGTAAAAALGFAVISGANGTLGNRGFGPADSPTDSDESIISSVIDEFENRGDSSKPASDFDPNSPIPVEIYAPDGARLTYNDLVGGIFGHQYDFWGDKVTTAEDIAQMTDLFENFYDYIKPDSDYRDGGFVVTDFGYLPDPVTGELKRYNKGDEYCGLILSSMTAGFDENGNYLNGGAFVDSTEIFAEITLGDKSKYNPGDYKFTSTDPALSALSGDPNSDEVHGEIGLFTEFPLNTPIKVGFQVTSIGYNHNETPSLVIGAYARSFKPFNNDLEQWLEKDLVLPTASLPEDFNFLSMDNIASEMGEEVRAVDDGEVIYKDSNSVLIKHGENRYTSYILLDVSVNKGDKVKAGDVIGTVNYDHGDPVGPELDYKFTREEPNMNYFNGFGIED